MPNQENTASIPRKSLTGLYRSQLTSPEKRHHITVSRQDMLGDTLERLHGAVPRQSKHHFLFIGPRGIGKSHFLSLIEDAVDRDAHLGAAYHVVRFPEEANRLLTFADFLLGVIEILLETLPDEPIWKRLSDELATEEDDAKIIDTLVPSLRRENKKHSRTLLIMLENLNQIFTSKMRKKNNVAAMRKFFMDHNHCMLMATSPTFFSAITSVDEPFYDFFDTQLINHLTEEETIDLIHKNLTWDKNEHLLTEFDSLRPKLRAIYQMTAGNPRLTMMLYELIAHDAVTKVRDQLDMLLDRITPFYQDRLNDLPPQEQALLETMATMRDTEKTPAAIAARMRMKQQQVSSLLKRLTDSLYLRSMPHPNDRRKRLYNIREGFFDIWLAMNVSRSARKRVPYLLDFFAAFYPTLEERDKKRREFHQKLKEEGNPDAEAALDYLSDVGREHEKAEAKLKLANHYVERGEQGKALSLINESQKCKLDPMGKWIVDHADVTTDYLGEIEQMIQCWQTHRSGNLEEFAGKLLALGDSINYLNYSETKLAFLSDQLALLPVGDDKIKLRLKTASIFSTLARFNEAEKQLRIAKNEAEENSHIFSVVINNLATLLQATNRLDEAEPMMRRSLEIDETSYGKDHPNVATSLNNLATLLAATNRLDKAEPMMRRALDIVETSYGKDHPEVAINLNNLAQLLEDTNRLDEAEPMMHRALKIDEASYGIDHPSVAIRLNNLAILLQATNRLDEAEPMMRRALEIDGASYGKDHPNVATSLNNLAQLLQASNRLDEAEPMMRRALEIDEASYGLDHPDYAIRLNNLAQLLQATNRLDEAEPMMRRHLLIFLKFTVGTSHRHPHLEAALCNYAALCDQMDMPRQEIFSRLHELKEEAGMNEGIFTTLIDEVFEKQ